LNRYCVAVKSAHTFRFLDLFWKSICSDQVREVNLGLPLEF